MFEQERLIVRLQQRVVADSDIVACYLGGSYGRRTEDAYADLDVVLVFASEQQREAAWQRRREFAKNITPYVPCKSFDADHTRPYLHVALYSNGAKADYRYESKTSLRPNPWERDLRILKDDSDGLIAAHQAHSAQIAITRPQISAAELTDLDERFWVMFWDVYRQVLRGDRDKPFTVYLELLHFSLPPLLRVLPPEDPAYQGLLNAYFLPDSQATANHLRQLLTAYLAARAAIVRRLNLMFTADTMFENQLQHVLERTVKQKKR